MATSALKSWPKGKNAKTCPCSRHAAMIANDLRSKRGIGKLLREAGYEVEHMADSIEAAIVSLWEAREFLEWEVLPPTKQHPLANGRWVPNTQKGNP